jgi:glycosyltransferase involved in cell wall biosynthesis
MLNCPKQRFVTFLIPSLNRPSLKRAVESVINQIDNDWECLVVFDGHYEEMKVPRAYREKIRCITHDHIGHAGLVRNIGLPCVNTTWTAFLDDDDVIKPTYIANLKKYIEKDPELKAVHFTIQWADGHLEIGLNDSPRHGCGCGIAYAIKTELIKSNNIRFDGNSWAEDLRFFLDCCSKGKHLISHDIQYLASGRSYWNGNGLERQEVKLPLRFI